MNLVPLRSDTLAQTQRVAAELFPWEHEHQLALTASLTPQSHLGFFAERGLSKVSFWTPEKHGAVAGLAGLYHYIAQPDEVWLAWYGLLPDARGHGKGAALLDWVIAEARSEHKKVLRLWTTDEAEYERALGLYATRGFHTEQWPSLPGETWRTLVLSLGLDGRIPMRWSSCAPNAELCGREAPQLVAA